MRASAFISYFFAGAFLTNSIPHLIVAATGRRNLTPSFLLLAHFLRFSRMKIAHAYVTLY